MSSIRALKYLTVFTGVACGLVSMRFNGPWVFTLPVYTFGLVPLLELFFRPDPQNMDEAELELARQDRLYDWVLYLLVPVQWMLMVRFVIVVQNPELLWWEILGKTWAAGIGCGVMGINVAHELGHRTKKYEQFMAKSLLLTSLYMHFFIEHNRGHHLRVSTPEDPASARRGEILYTFWLRSVWQSYRSAWALENSRMRRKGLPILHWRNEMLVYQVIQGALLGGIAWAFGWQTMLLYIAAATLGFLLLETVNYIEHYGLARKRLPDGTYERVQPAHSWNSDHPVGRLILFELSRHSDHHYRSGRKYQLLRHMEGSPQMPTGYPGMLILSTIPPLWFAVMHRAIARFEGEGKLVAA
jgi:alkane 1-monooxygenase